MNPYGQALRSSEEADRLYAVQDLMESPSPDGASLLVERLPGEPSQAVKDAIVFALKTLPCSKSYEDLFRLFRSEDAYLRNAAVSVFGSQGPEALAFLTAHLDHADREVRKLILDALFEIGGLEARLAIRAGLHDPSLNVRITAVEYLGRLEDRDSVEEMLQLFEEETDPMLRTTILESLALVGKDGDVKAVLSVLAPGRGLAAVDPLYVPAVLRLAMEHGNLGTLEGLLRGLTDLRTYAEDVLQAVGVAKNRFAEELEGDFFLEEVLAILGDPEVSEGVRYAAVEDLLSRPREVLPSRRLCELGMDLLSRKGMAYGGVRLLASSGEKAGLDKILEIMGETRDPELRGLCEELAAEGTGEAEGSPTPGSRDIPAGRG